MRSKEVRFVFACTCIVMLILSEHRAGACKCPGHLDKYQYRCACNLKRELAKIVSQRKAAHIKYMEKAFKSALSQLQVSFFAFIPGWFLDDSTHILSYCVILCHIVSYCTARRSLDLLHYDKFYPFFAEVQTTIGRWNPHLNLHRQRTTIIQTKLTILKWQEPISKDLFTYKAFPNNPMFINYIMFLTWSMSKTW